MQRASLQLLPRFSDGLTFLYVEHARVEQSLGAIVLVRTDVRVPVPIAALATLMLGPGTSVTHAAMVACANAGCSVVFCGEAGVRLYASGLGDTRRADGLLAHAAAWGDTSARMQVVRRMYAMRFADALPNDLTLEQVRGREGVRVRGTYASLAKETGISWPGRVYGGEWSAAAPVNRALSTANACLYGLCHAAIVSIGMSPGLGFVHSGKSLAFVYDVADLYKCETTIPIAFRDARHEPLNDLESAVRRACRDSFRETKLIERIVPDIQRCLGVRQDIVRLVELAEEDWTEEVLEATS